MYAGEKVLETYYPSMLHLCSNSKIDNDFKDAMRAGN